MKSTHSPRNKELRQLLQAYLDRDSFEQQFGTAEYEIAILLLLISRIEKLTSSVANLEKNLVNVLERIGRTMELKM